MTVRRFRWRIAAVLSALLIASGILTQSAATTRRASTRHVA